MEEAQGQALAGTIGLPWNSVVVKACHEITLTFIKLEVLWDKVSRHQLVKVISWRLLSETRYEDLNYEESLEALLERPLVEPEISTDT